MKSTANWPAAAIFIAVLGAVVALELAGHQDGIANILTLAGPVVGALFVMDRIDRRSDAQDQVLSKVEHQTNGVLDKRIQDQTLTALAKAGIVQAPADPLPAPGLSVAPAEPEYTAEHGKPPAPVND